MQASLATETPDAVINRECRRIMEVATAQGFLKQQQWLSQRLNPQEQSAASELEAALPDWRDATGGLERFRNLTEAFRPRYDRSTFHNINKLLIVNLAFLGIAQNVVGFGEGLELFFRGLVAGIDVGVILAGQLAKGSADFVRRGRLLYTQNFVVVLFSGVGH